MKVDYIIHNGMVMDPATGEEKIRDVAVNGDRIVDTEGLTLECDHIIDAKDCIVTPGLIDFHTHIFYNGSSIGIKPDFMIPQGTTAAVDAGTAGTANFPAFYDTAVVPSTVRIKSFLTVYSGGQLDPKLCEDFNPKLYNVNRMERLIDKYRDNILGLKVRLSKGVVPDEKGKEYLTAIVELAEQLSEKLDTKLRVCVHTSNGVITAGQLADCLRPGDIFCHCYQGSGNTILLENGEIDPDVLNARDRGVIFDAANGKGNFDISVARKAIERGFLPDIISSDLTSDKFNMPPYAKNLPMVMAKYLELGMGFMEILKAVTVKPAQIMKMSGKIGTLQAGGYADIAILKLKEKRVVQKDWKDEPVTMGHVIVPKMTICAGEIQYCATDFWC